MKTNRITIAAVALAIMGTAPAYWPAPARAQDAAAQPAPDNTGTNVQDRHDATLTPMDQSNKPSDIRLTRRIRQALVANKSLSTDAKNVKIITVDGKVTLRGPVKNQEEMRKIGHKAQQIAGAGNVDNQLEVSSNQ